MKRLTKRETADALKVNAEKLREIGFEPSILDRRYIKLAEYEDREEQEQRNYNTAWKTYYFDAVIYNPCAEERRTVHISVLNDRDFTEEQIYIIAVKEAFKNLDTAKNEFILRLDYKTRHKWR